MNGPIGLMALAPSPVEEESGPIAEQLRFQKPSVVILVTDLPLVQKAAMLNHVEVI